MKVQRREERLGGAANVARNVAAVGVAHGAADRAGRRRRRAKVSRLLAEAGIEPQVHLDPSLPTTVKLRVIGRRQQMLRVDFENVPEAETLAALLDNYVSLLPTHDLVILSDYGKGGLAHIAGMIEQAREPANRCWSIPRATITRATRARPC